MNTKKVECRQWGKKMEKKLLETEVRESASFAMIIITSSNGETFKSSRVTKQIFSADNSVGYYK